MKRQDTLIKFNNKSVFYFIETVYEGKEVAEWMQCLKKEKN